MAMSPPPRPGPSPTTFAVSRGATVPPLSGRRAAGPAEDPGEPPDLVERVVERHRGDPDHVGRPEVDHDVRRGECLQHVPGAIADADGELAAPRRGLTRRDRLDTLPRDPIDQVLEVAAPRDRLGP